MKTKAPREAHGREEELGRAWNQDCEKGKKIGGPPTKVRKHHSVMWETARIQARGTFLKGSYREDAASTAKYGWGADR